MRVLQIIMIGITLVPMFAQSPKPNGRVTSTGAEFKIPLRSPANGIWIWNRSDVPDNDNEYLWTITAKNKAAQYSFGFYLYKLPGSRETRGALKELLRSGQASIFQEDAEGRGKLLPKAPVEVSVEDGEILIRIKDPKLVRLIFHERPETVDVHSRTPDADFQVIQVTYVD